MLRNFVLRHHQPKLTQIHRSCETDYRGRGECVLVWDATLPQRRKKKTKQKKKPQEIEKKILRRPGIEPGSQEWESCMIPLHQRRFMRYRSVMRGF